MNAARCGQNVRIKLKKNRKTLNTKADNLFNHETQKRNLNMNVGLIIKFYSTAMRDNRKLCEFHTIFFSFENCHFYTHTYEL